MPFPFGTGRQSLTVGPAIRVVSVGESKIEFGPFLAVLGCLVCVLVVSQIGYWCAMKLDAFRSLQTRLQQNQKTRRALIDESSLLANTESKRDRPAWNGYRKFHVSKIVKEAEQISSVYLRPEDGRPLPSFKPGQHLTFRFQIPGQLKPVVRCYSLSDSPQSDHYRITVKACPPPANQPEAPRGLVSHFVNLQLNENELVDVKAPSGNFFLDVEEADPVVLLAGGIGITPMLSMINTLIARQSDRLILLVYAVQNSRQHPFGEHFAELESRHRNLQVVTCYSSPLESDQIGKDFNYQGYASIDLLKQLLPNQGLQFYMCGPPAFMSSLYTGLIQWGVVDSQIHFESFGPASIKRVSEQADVFEENGDDQTKTYSVEFCRSNQKLEWTGEHDNLLEFAEANGIPMDSGCRSGNCGTCEIEIHAGKVKHSEPDAVSAGKCLACIATPVEHVQLEA